MLFLTSCGKEEVEDLPIDSPTVVLCEDGSLIRYQVESFQKDYYKIDELQSMLNEEIASFNRVNPSAEGEMAAISEGAVSVPAGLTGSVMVMMHFRDSETCVKYSNMVEKQSSVLFYGTLQEAMGLGYEFGLQAKSVKDQSFITDKQIEKYQNNKVLIIQDNVQIRCPSKILFVSDNLRVNEQGYAEVAATEGLKYIIMK